MGKEKKALVGTDYSLPTIFQHVILPLFDQYETEIRAFADPNVRATPDIPAEGGPDLSWTGLLVDASKIPPHPENEKYIELERMLSSIISFHLFYDGSEAAHRFFIQCQPEAKALSYDSFLVLHELAQQVAADAECFSAVVAYLVYSDFGKTPSARALGIDQHDHDDLIAAILSQEEASIEAILPSAATLPDQARDLIKNVQKVKVHFGHVRHLEGGTGMLDAFAANVRKGYITDRFFDFARLIQYCDVAAVDAHTRIDGSTILDEATFRDYESVAEILQYVRNGGSEEDALNIGYQHRASLLEVLDCANLFEQVLLRIASLLRLHTHREGAALLDAAGALYRTDQHLLQSVLALDGVANKMKRNPTYFPAIATNLVRQSQRQEASLSIQLSRALLGFLCGAKIIEAYAAVSDNARSPHPLSFCQFANYVGQLDDMDMFLASFDLELLWFDGYEVKYGIEMSNFFNKKVTQADAQDAMHAALERDDLNQLCAQGYFVNEGMSFGNFRVVVRADDWQPEVQTYNLLSFVHNEGDRQVICANVGYDPESKQVTALDDAAEQSCDIAAQFRRYLDLPIDSTVIAHHVLSPSLKMSL